MADAYLTELRAVQARGPYYLAGYCGGTLVALELAARLLSEGERVAFLGVIDLYRPGLPLASSRLGNLVSAMRRQNPATLAKQVPLKLKAAARESFSELRVRFHEARHDVMPYELRERWLMAAFMRAAQRYELRPYRGKLTVFRARDGNRGENGAPILRDPGPELGWGPLATLGIEAHEAPGDHQSLVVPPNVGVLASQLEDCLREAETPHRSS
jgi:thioesterase domain-containing protein